MESAFSWLGQLIESLMTIIPKLVMIRATHGGVKWRCGKKVIYLGPGLHIFWPLVSEINIIVVARQTLKLPNQVLTTRDAKKVVVGGVAVYKIRNVVDAIGEKNWDVDTTVGDISQAALAKIISTSTLAELHNGLALNGDSDFNRRLTLEARRQLRQYGVHISTLKIIDFAETKVFKIFGDSEIENHSLQAL